MARIVGIDLPNYKRVDIALTNLYGIGRSNVKTLLIKANVDGSKRVKELTEEEVGKITKVIDKDIKVEGDLRAQISENIKRLREIGSYRGMRHSKNLPAHGQRTRSNARTLRGKRKTVGALKKDIRAKLETTAPASATSSTS